MELCGGLKWHSAADFLGKTYPTSLLSLCPRWRSPPPTSGVTLLSGIHSLSFDPLWEMSLNLIKGNCACHLVTETLRYNDGE